MKTVLAVSLLLAGCGGNAFSAAAVDEAGARHDADAPAADALPEVDAAADVGNDAQESSAETCALGVCCPAPATPGCIPGADCNGTTVTCTVVPGCCLPGNWAPQHGQSPVCEPPETPTIGHCPDTRTN